MALDSLSSPRGAGLRDVSASSTHELPNLGANPTPFTGALTAPSVPAPFIIKIYDLVDDPDTNTVISWSIQGNSFVVWNSHELCQQLLPRYFKHKNFSSFVRQLNTYGFRKIDPRRWEFANDEFQRGHRHLTRGIHRKKSVASALKQEQHDHHSGSSSMLPSGSVVEVGIFGVEGEIEQLKRDKNVLMMEVMCLQQHLQITEGDLHAMWQRLQTSETCQQYMVSFIAKAMHNPAFLAQFMQQLSTENIDEIVPKRRQLNDLSTAIVAHDLETCDTTNELWLLPGKEILNPNQQHVSVRGMEAESSMQAKANWDKILSQSNQNGGAFGAAPCGNKLSNDQSTFGKQQAAQHSSCNIKPEQLVDERYMKNSSSSQGDASRSAVSFSTQYSAGTRQELGTSATKHVRGAHPYDVYHTADGHFLCQYDKYHAAEAGLSACQCDCKVADRLATNCAPDERLIHSVADHPSYWPGDGLGMAMAPQAVRHAPNSSHGEEAQAAPDRQKDTSKSIDRTRWMRDL